MSLTYPIVCQKNDGKYYIDFYLNKKRYRLFNAKKIGIDYKPNNYPVNKRQKATEQLAKMVYDHLVKNNYQFEESKECPELQEFDRLISLKLNEPLDKHYKKTLEDLAHKLREELKHSGNANDNIFSNTPIEFNEDYFKTLWSRFKKKNPEIGKHTTIYSFRHSGAIEIFKRTGSLHKLQRAMGHSSLNVSLTYLRGLEVAELKEEDMPMV